MKQRTTTTGANQATILALLGEQPRSSRELAKALGVTNAKLTPVLADLKRQGKIASSGERNAPYRIHGHGFSSPREEDDPTPDTPKPTKLGPNLRSIILDALRGGPLSRGDIVEQVRPHLNGRNEAGVDAALGGLARAQLVHRDGGMYRLGAGASRDEDRRATRASRRLAARAKEPTAGALGLLYAERDRIDRAIAVLEGRA